MANQEKLKPIAKTDPVNKENATPQLKQSIKIPPIGLPLQNSDFIDFMQENGLSKEKVESISWISKLHHYAKWGNLEKIKRFLKNNPTKIEEIDCNGWTPLFYAAFYQRLKTVKFLLNEGAILRNADIYQRNILHYAKKNNRHTPMSKYLKALISLQQDILDNFAFEFESILEKELLLASKANKKILIILGESHGSHQLYQLEKRLLMVAKKLGVGSLLTELPAIHLSTAIEKKANDSYKMQVLGIDNHPNRQTATVEQRNEVIAKEINHFEEDAVFITGYIHMHGLLTNASSLVDRNKYHIVPINLAAILENEKCDNSVDSKFAFDTKKIIQCRHHTFTDSKRVSQKWNSVDVQAKARPQRSVLR